MATYEELVRSNYFAVKDPEAWETFCERWGVSPIKDAQGRHGLMGGEMNSCIIDDEGNEDEKADFDSELEDQLADGEVCVIQGVGNEKLRFLIGYAKAISPGRDMIYLDLGRIYDLVEEQWQVKPTLAEY